MVQYIVTVLEMFSRAQFFTKTEGCIFFFSQPVARLTNQGHVWDSRAGALLRCNMDIKGLLLKGFVLDKLSFFVKNYSHLQFQKPFQFCIFQASSFMIS
jgi:hypothetical protein